MSEDLYTDVEEMLHIPPGARSSDDVEVLAWFRWTLGINALHQPLKDKQRREAPNSTTIKAEQFKIPTWHLAILLSLRQSYGVDCTEYKVNISISRESLWMSCLSINVLRKRTMDRCIP
jgi:hypothetical protein